MTQKKNEAISKHEEASREKSGFTVVITERINRKIEKLPEEVQETFGFLVEDLMEKGPFRPEWKSSPLSQDLYHCHLTRKWVAVWEWKKKSLAIRIEYVGSREGAPYAK